MAAGDQIRLAFSAGSDGYAYVVIRDAQGGVSMLYPERPLRGASRVKAGSVYQVPGGRPLVHGGSAGGLAAIYLIAGHDPLENLEELAEEAESGALARGAHRAVELPPSRDSLDGKRAAVPRPVRTRRGREIVDGLAPAPPPSVWPAAPGSSSTGRASPRPRRDC